MDAKGTAEQLCKYLSGINEINRCRIYGSIADNSYDEYSDMDIEIDVSGTDNSIFVTKIPEIMSEKYNVVFFDYAPSMAPEKYIVSAAVSSDHPFLIADICCLATPHCTTLSKEDLSALNNRYDHILKLFTANLKHYIRGAECQDDMKKMFRRIFKDSAQILDEKEMLNLVYSWLQDNSDSHYDAYLNALGKYL